MWSRRDLTEGAANLLDLDHASPDRLVAYMAAAFRLSESSQADDGHSWEIVKTFLVLVSAIAENEGVMVTPETSTELGRRAISVLQEAIGSAHRKAQGLPPKQMPPDPFEI